MDPDIVPGGNVISEYNDGHSEFCRERENISSNCRHPEQDYVDGDGRSLSTPRKVAIIYLDSFMFPIENTHESKQNIILYTYCILYMNNKFFLIFDLMFY